MTQKLRERLERHCNQQELHALAQVHIRWLELARCGMAQRVMLVAAAEVCPDWEERHAFWTAKLALYARLALAEESEQLLVAVATQTVPDKVQERRHDRQLEQIVQCLKVVEYANDIARRGADSWTRAVDLAAA
ncbi:MAG: hypothetical protein M3N59_00675 [bacterium]|nr:hypothetical protein [bacterium]